jgi:hypothetical protein
LLTMYASAHCYQLRNSKSRHRRYLVICSLDVFSDLLSTSLPPAARARMANSPLLMSTSYICPGLYLMARPNPNSQKVDTLRYSLRLHSRYRGYHSQSGSPQVQSSGCRGSVAHTMVHGRKWNGYVQSATHGSIPLYPNSNDFGLRSYHHILSGLLPPILCRFLS